MPWHVAQGRYFMVYDPGMQPYDMVGKAGQEHSLAMIVHIRYGLLGSGLGCNGQPAGPNNPEAHYSVDDTTTVLVLRWSANDRVFVAGGVGRLYFDPAVTGQQRALLETAFQNTAVGPLEALRTIPNWLPSATLAGPPAVIPPNVDAAPINITVPAAAARNFGSLNLQPRTNTVLTQGGFVVNHRLLNCAPEFRLGGQNPDLEGVTLADGRTAVSISNWADPAFKGFAGPIDLSGQGEIRDFEWQGADAPFGIPFYFRATSFAARENDLRTRLLSPIMPFIPIENPG